LNASIKWVLPIAVLLGSSCAWATDVSFDKASLSLSKNAATAQTVGILVKDLPAGGTFAFASFYLVWDKTKLELSNFVWDATILDSPGVDTPFADGLNVSHAKIMATGTLSNTKPLVTFDVKPLADVVGDFSIGFKTTDPLNVLQDDFGATIAVGSWGTLPVHVKAEPDPAKISSVSYGAARQRDPITVTFAWTAGTAESLEMQYSDDGGSTWKAPAAGSTTADLTAKTMTWTTGFTANTTVKIRGRAIDQGKVWNGTAIVDADDTGWVAAAGDLLVDNVAPVPQSANGSGSEVNIAFQTGELLDATSAANKANYEVTLKGTSTTVTINSATFVSPNGVKLTLASALAGDKNYSVRIQNVADAVGNAMAAPVTLDIVQAPNPARITGITFQGGNRVKDPLVAILAWTQGYASSIEGQYSDDGGTTWKALPSAVPNISAKTITSTTGFTGNKTIKIRARAIHMGNVWNGSAIVPVAADLGWVVAASDVTVDNERPNPLTAVGAAGTKLIVVTFQASELLNEASAETLANYKVLDNGVLPAAVGDVIPLKSAVFVSPNVVNLTLADSVAAIAEGQKYKVQVSGVLDVAGNAVSGTKDLLFEIPRNPNLVSAEFRNRTTVRATFNKAMNASTIASGWALNPSVAVTAVTAVGSDGKVFDLTVATMAEATNYTLTAPAGAKDTGGLGIINRTAAFKSRRWHDFAAGTLMMGVPLTDTGRARSILGADKVATYLPGTAAYSIDDGGATSVALIPGAGYFAKFGAATTSYFDGNPIAGDAKVNVGVGWNLLSPPRDITLDKISPAFKYAWYWTAAGGYQLKAKLTGSLNIVDDQLYAWNGYFVRSGSAGEVSVGTASAAADAGALSIGGADAKLIRLVATSEGAPDTFNVCGVGSSAATLPNPPAASDGPDIYFLKDGGVEPLAVDVRTGSLTQKWNVVVAGGVVGQSVTVSAPDLSAIPGDYAVILTDVDSGRKCYLRTAAGYTFKAAEAPKALTVEIVPRTQATLMGAVSVQSTGAKNAVITYSLNGPASVSAQVCNIAGRPIRQVVSDRVETAGTHSLSWNLASDAGSLVPRGLYMIVVEARSEDGQQVRVVRPFSVNR
jgi:hypothetical protein